MADQSTLVKEKVTVQVITGGGEIESSTLRVEFEISKGGYGFNMKDAAKEDFQATLREALMGRAARLQARQTAGQ